MKVKNHFVKHCNIDEVIMVRFLLIMLLTVSGNLWCASDSSSLSFRQRLGLNRVVNFLRSHHNGAGRVLLNRDLSQLPQEQLEVLLDSYNLDLEIDGSGRRYAAGRYYSEDELENDEIDQDEAFPLAAVSKKPEQLSDYFKRKREAGSITALSKLHETLNREMKIPGGCIAMTPEANKRRRQETPQAGSINYATLGVPLLPYDVQAKKGIRVRDENYQPEQQQRQGRLQPRALFRD